MNTSGGLTRKQQELAERAEGTNHMNALLEKMEPQIKKALPSVITPERFTRLVLTAFSSSPKLRECTTESFLGAMMQAAQLGVEPNTPLGQAYMIPYRNHGQLECQFQLGYRGLIDLAYRSGEIKTIQAHVVHQNDTFEYEFGLEPKLKHIPALTNRGPVVMYYAVLKLKNGGESFDVMSHDDVEQFAQKYSKSYKNGPWQDNFDEMAKKTVLKKVLKYAPLRSDFVRAVSADETVKSHISDDMLSEPNEIHTTIDAEPIQDGYEGGNGGTVPPGVDPSTGEVAQH